MTNALPYRTLRDEAEKEKFIQAIRKVRQNVLQLAATVPPDQWHSPRYHNWSLAGMLGHLHLIDSLAKRLLQASLLGIRVPIPLGLINRFNDFVTPLLGKRDLEKTRNQLIQNEDAIIAFIQALPQDKYDTPVYSVLDQGYITLEQAVQLYYLFHWHDHYRTMRQVDGIFYEPPNSTVV